MANRVYAQRDSSQDALRMWEKVISAKGGHDKLGAITSLVVTTKSHNTNDEKQFQNLFIQDLYVLPDRWWRWTDHRPGFPLYAGYFDFDKEIGYQESGLSEKIVTFRPKKPRDPGSSVSLLELDGSGFNENHKAMFFHNQMIYLMETKWLKPLIQKSRTERSGLKNVDIVVASFGEKQYEYFLDSKTGLPSKIKVITCFAGLPTCDEDTLYLSDYMSISGVKLPQVVSRGKGDDTRVTYQVNVPYDSNLFDRKPSINAGPDAWKPHIKF